LKAAGNEVKKHGLMQPFQVWPLPYRYRRGNQHMPMGSKSWWGQQATGDSAGQGFFLSNVGQRIQ